MEKEIFVFSSEELVSLKLVLPREQAGDFIVAFGEAFATNNGKDVRKVDNYFSAQEDWHIRVSFYEGQKDRFYAFIRKFSEEKNCHLVASACKPRHRE